MKDVLKYKGFIGSVHFSAEDGVFFGKIEGINDLVTFEGSSVKELTDAFHYVVDEHIKDCEKENVDAGKSYKGSFNIRISPELHRRIATSAKTKGLSINKYINEVLSEYVHP
ncbi:MAG: type II toxin-antitoxin system HicB family antitoxin [Prolixibacteraceae bacterium]|nr:type II toxin-antitoxin system HicB family antitoxin [Prolixibacteraceae bacterium]